MSNKKGKAAAIVKALDLPPEIILGIPKIYVLPENEATIQNHKGIIEYSNEYVSINTSCGIVRFWGCGLGIKSITDEEIQIEGSVMGFDIK